MFRQSLPILRTGYQLVQRSITTTGTTSYGVFNTTTVGSIQSVLKNNYQSIQSYSTAATAEVKVPTNLIQELRKKTSAPISDCKKALQSNDNDIEKAIAWLFEKGKATAVKLSNRVSVEGVVTVLIDESNQKGVILEMNSETDFVSRGDTFRALVKDISVSTLKSKGILTNASNKVQELPIETINKQVNVDVEGVNVPVSDAIVRTVSKLRENLILRRASGLENTNNNTLVAGYVHDPTGTRQFGRLGSLLSLEYGSGVSDLSALKQFANDIAVHIVGVGPSFVSIADVPQSLLDECKATKRHPNSLYDEVVLLEQKYISGNDGESVKDAIERVSKQLNTTITVKSFVRYVVGEGLEKKEENYGAEVMEKLNAAKK